MSPIGGFLRELRRRKVYHVAVAYVIVALAVWGAADFAFPSLGLPGTAEALVVMLTMLGFPVALVLAWAYALRPDEKGERDGSAGEEGARTRVGGRRWTLTASRWIPCDAS